MMLMIDARRKMQVEGGIMVFSRTILQPAGDGLPSAGLRPASDRAGAGLWQGLAPACRTSCSPTGGRPPPLN